MALVLQIVLSQAFPRFYLTPMQKNSCERKSEGWPRHRASVHVCGSSYYLRVGINYFSTPDCAATVCREQGQHLIKKIQYLIDHYISIQIKFEEVCSQCSEASTD